MERVWTRVADRLPGDGDRVLCYLPGNKVFLPGMRGAEERNVVVLRFARDFFLKNPSKTGKASGDHFWLGEGGSNHFFADVTHWMPLPEEPR